MATNTRVMIMLGAMALSSNQVQSSEISYDYIEGGYYLDHYEGTYTDKDYEGVIVRASKSLNGTTYIVGSYSYTEADWSDPGEHEEQDEDIYTVGIGGHLPITGGTDGVIELSYIYWDRDWKRTSPTTSNKNYTDDFFALDLGVRHLVTADTEINGGVEILRGGSLGTDSELFYVGAMTEIGGGYSVGATYRSYAFPLDGDYWNTNLVIRADY